jgi:hypothetical protein
VFTDILLIVITLAVAVIGTLWRDPPRSMKISLIVLAMVASGASVFKAISDAGDKNFIKFALTSTLKPSNAQFHQLIVDVDKAMKDSHRKQGECNHGDDGMVCFLVSTESDTRRGTLVLERGDLGTLYATELDHGDTGKVINDVCARQYNPDDLGEDFKARVALLGTAVYFDVFKKEGSESSYDDSFGVRITFEGRGKRDEVVLAPDELRAFKPDNACGLFYNVEQSFRGRFRPFTIQSGQ